MTAERQQFFRHSLQLINSVKLRLLHLFDLCTQRQNCPHRHAGAMSFPRGPATKRGGGRGTPRTNKPEDLTSRPTLRSTRGAGRGRGMFNASGSPIASPRVATSLRSQQTQDQTWRSLENAGTSEWKTRMEELWLSVRASHPLLTMIVP